MARGAQSVAGEGVAELAERVFGRARGRRSLDDFGAEGLAAEMGVLVRLGAAEPVVHMERRDAVAELAERVPEAGRVGPAGDEREHLAAGRNQVVTADLLLDPRTQVAGGAQTL